MANLELIGYSVALLICTTYIYEVASHRVYTMRWICERRCFGDKICVRIRTRSPFRWECQAVDCGPLASPAGGSAATPNGTVLNANAVYSCMSGYYMTGNPIRTCQADNQWSGTEPTCTPIVCGALTDPTNGQVNTQAGTAFGNEALYQCDTGYVLSGPSSRLCKINGSWTGSEPVCNAVVDCGPLASPAGGSVATPNGTVLNANAVYSCISGYYMTGNPIRTCQADNQWSGTEPTCTPIVCGGLTDPANGQVNTPGGTSFGNEALYQCDMGYVLSGPSSRLCKINGSWTGSEPVCNAVDCGYLGNPCNGEVDISGGTQFNQQAVYSCQDGYTLIGDAERSCPLSGHWNGSQPCCIWNCGSLSNPANGEVSTPEGTLLGSEALYECEEGAHLSGNSIRTCQIGGWSGEEPQCRFCPDEFEYYFDVTDSCYFIQNGTNWPAGAANWLEAREACLNKSSKLAEVETGDEHLFLIDTLNDIGAGSGTDYYIGGREIEENSWVWDSTNETITTYFWGQGRPFHDYKLSCLFMCDGCTDVQKFYWNDYFCDSYWRQYICEVPAL